MNSHIFVITSIIALIAAAGYALYLYDKRRSEKIAALAPLLGLTYYGSGNSRAADILHFHFPLFEKGYRGQLRNLLLGEVNQETLAIFEYFYSQHSNSRQHSKNKTSSQTVFFIHSKKLNLPELTIAPENFFHKLAEYVGYQDIDLPELPEFSKKFLLRGRNETHVRNLMSAKLAAFLLESHPICVETLPQAIIVYRAGTMLQPETLQNALEDAKRLAQLFGAA